ncbi:MAG TPA: glycosyltransferase [Gemmataceae bacterium]|nr:glycosyltransferase [Gemmataceae bacterium]
MAKVLMGCVNYWTSPFQVGSHHLARQFVRAGYEVGFLSEPITPLHFLGRPGRDLARRLGLYLCPRRFEGGKLWTGVPGALLAPHHSPGLRAAWLLDGWWKLSYPSLVRTIARRGFQEVDVLYLDSVKHHFWLDQVRAKCSIYRVADYNAGFGNFTGAMRRLEERLIRTVDIVAYSSERLGEVVRKLGPRHMVYLPNGVDFDHFQGSRALPPEYARLPGPRVVYVGALDVWFDYELLTHAAQQLPKVSFVLIGPDRTARARLKGLTNVHLIGPRPYVQLPAYLQHADAGIIPFDVGGRPDLVHAVNPLKLYECLACGLPVIATAWEALRALRSPAYLTTTPQEFVHELRRALATPHDRTSYMQYAARMDWARCASSLFHLVKGLTACGTPTRLAG